MYWITINRNKLLLVPKDRVILISSCCSSRITYTHRQRYACLYIYTHTSTHASTHTHTQMHMYICTNTHTCNTELISLHFIFFSKKDYPEVPSQLPTSNTISRTAAHDYIQSLSNVCKKK